MISALFLVISVVFAVVFNGGYFIFTYSLQVDFEPR